MSSYGLFIGIQDIKDESPLDENVDEKTIRLSIITAQEENIQQVIGSGLFLEVKGQIETQTLSTANTALLSQARRGLIYWTCYHVCGNGGHFKLMNRGINTRSSDNATPVETVDVVKQMDYFRDRANPACEQLRAWLLQNATTYPLFENPGSGIDTIYPSADIVTGMCLDNEDYFSGKNFIEVSYNRKNPCR